MHSFNSMETQPGSNHAVCREMSYEAEGFLDERPELSELLNRIFHQFSHQPASDGLGLARETRAFMILPPPLSPNNIEIPASENTQSSGDAHRSCRHYHPPRLGGSFNLLQA
jgi:hypothetical protein